MKRFVWSDTKISLHTPCVINYRYLYYFVRMENPPGHLVRIGFWSPWDEMSKKCQYLAQNNQKCIYWVKFGLFWAKNLNLTGGSKTFGTHVTEKPPRHLVRIVFWSAMGSNGPKMPVLGQIWPFFGPKSIFGGME